MYGQRPLRTLMMLLQRAGHYWSADNASQTDAGRWVVGVYLAYSTQPSAYGAASSFAALLLWLYYTAQIFLFGAEFTSCLAGLRTATDRDVTEHSSSMNRIAAR